MCRITLNRKKAELKLGVYCLSKDWDDKLGLPKKNSDDEKIKTAKIHNVQSLIDNWVHDAEREGKQITAAQLKDSLTGKTEFKHTLVSMSKWVIERYEKTNQAPEQLSKLKQTFKYLEQYLIWDKKIGLQLENVTNQTVKDFESYLKSEAKYGPMQKNLDVNTIGKHLTRFKTIWNYAMSSELVTKNVFSGYRILKIKRRKISLSLEEFKVLRDLDLSKCPEKDRVRDTFIFCCYMGMRFGDAQGLLINDLQLSKSKKINTENFGKMDFLSDKNNAQIQVPILSAAKEILDKYSENNFRIIEGWLLPQFTNQHANRVLKELAIDAKIDSTKKLTFHLSRHTCAQLQFEAEIQEKVTAAWLGQISNSITSQYQNTYDKILFQAAVKFESYLST
jgi:integrase